MHLNWFNAVVTSALWLSAASAVHAGACEHGIFLVVAAAPTDRAPRRDAVIRLSEAQIRQLPSASITTATEWTRSSRFEGPRLKDVMKLAGVRGRSLRLTALDDYVTSIPWSDLDAYGVILALSRDGQRLSTSDIGPLFVIYPRDQFPQELKTPSSQAKFVWQLCRIDVE